jgi:hypothetical protein
MRKNAFTPLRTDLPQRNVAEVTHVAKATAEASQVKRSDIRNTDMMMSQNLVDTILTIENRNKEANNFDYSNQDPSNNISYEEKGTQKISLDIIVPDYLVSLLIGKNGECIRGIMNKSGSMINFQKEVIIY